MAKSLNLVLAAARGRISGQDAGSTGRPRDGETSTTLGKDPGVDYAPKAGDERAFVAKHKHIEQDYPTGMKDAFQGNAAKFTMDTPQMKHYGNKMPEAEKAYQNEEVEQVDEISKKLAGRYLDKNADTYNKTVAKGDRLKSRNRGNGASLATKKLLNINVKVPTSEETLDEMWKATQNDKGEHVLKHKSGKVSSKTYGSKGEAIDAAVRRNKSSGAFGEEVQLAELHKDMCTDCKTEATKHKALADYHDKKTDHYGSDEHHDPEQNDRHDTLRHYHSQAHEHYSKAAAHFKSGDDHQGWKHHNAGHQRNNDSWEFKNRHGIKEEVLDEISRKTLGSYVSKAAGEISHHRASMSDHSIAGNKKAYNDAKRKTINRVKGVEKAGDRLAKEEIELDEMWKATQNEKGEHVLKHKSGKVSSKTYGSKGEAIDAAVRRNKSSGAFGEETIQEDEEGKPAKPASHSYHIIDTHTKAVVGKAKTLRHALNSVDRRDNAYGAYRYTHRRVDEEVESIQELAKAAIKRFKRGMSKALNDKDDEKKETKEETQFDEIKVPSNYAEIMRRKKAKQAKHDPMKDNPKEGPMDYDDEPDLAKKKKPVKEESQQVDEANIENKEKSRSFRAGKLSKLGNGNGAVAKNMRKHAADKIGFSKAQRHYEAGRKTNEETEEDMDVVEGILCDKKSLAKKAKYHKGKMQGEEAGSTRFRHHQKQAHIIKGMMEDAGIDEEGNLLEKKEDDGWVYKKDKRGFMVKTRKYVKKDLPPGPGKLGEDVDPQVARIFEHINKEQF